MLNLTPDSLVIIPVYNECPQILTRVVKDWLDVGVCICLVDDGSSLPVVFSSDGVKVLKHATNLGQGAALATGLEYALTTSCRYFLTVDADGQHPSSNLQQLLQPLEANTVDIVFGSRFLSVENSRSVPWLRRQLLRLAVRFNNYVTGLKMTDAHNGLRAMNRSAVRQINITEARMAHASEIPVRVRQKGLRWCEIPVDIQYSEYAKSKGQSLWRIFPLSMQLLRLKWRNA